MTTEAESGFDAALAAGPARRPLALGRPRFGGLRGLLLPALLLAAWEGAARAGWLAPNLLPAPTAVLRALDRFGLTEKDVRLVLLQHPDGKNALLSHQVDAWAGLDPYMAQAEVEDGAELFFRDPDLNTYGVLNVRQELAEDHPELVGRVLTVYETAREHAIGHPDELKATLIKAAKLSDAVATKQLGERTDLSDPVIGPKQRESILAAGLVLKKAGIIRADETVESAVDGLIDPQYIERVIKKLASL